MLFTAIDTIHQQFQLSAGHVQLREMSIKTDLSNATGSDCVYRVLEELERM